LPAAWPSEHEPEDARLALSEPERLIQRASSLLPIVRGEIDPRSTGCTGPRRGVVYERTTDPAPSRVRRHHEVIQEGLRTGERLEDDSVTIPTTRSPLSAT
jgi:hypothetical protein